MIYISHYFSALQPHAAPYYGHGKAMYVFAFYAFSISKIHLHYSEDPYDGDHEHLEDHKVDEDGFCFKASW